MSRTIDLRKICLNALNSAINSIIILLTGIKSQTDKLTFNGDKLKVDAVVNFDSSGTNIILADFSATVSINQNNTAVLLAAQNSVRRSIKIHNDSENILYIKYNGGITQTNYSIKLFRQDYANLEDFRGNIYGIWDVAGPGAALITEVTD